MKQLALLAVAAVFAFAAALFWQARQPSQDGEAFDLAAFFAGRSVIEGSILTLAMFEEPFTARFEGTVEGDSLRLEERFAFADGERLQVWELAVSPSGAVSGTVETEMSDGALAPAVPVSGASSTSGVVLDYEGHAPGGGARTFRFRHHLRGQAGGTVRNHVVVSKFGLPLATSRVVFAKDPATLSTARGDR
ncbi:DUF3833 family protein [Aureimonas mangrovi]|uniref:DUF3833 family protein n=1 Tax=Aureimonas mangrovi TaxID=2758041 RepID=UPI00163DC67B|nr:DUF3833 family protein [Aureimonas mangrovi]